MPFFESLGFFRDFLRPILDVAILSFLIYRSYRILVQTQAIQLVKGALLVAVIYVAAIFFNLGTLLWVLNMLVPGLVIAVAIIFQPELRKIFTRIGQGDWFKFSTLGKSTQLDAVINAAEVLSARKRGCLIVFSRNVGLKNIIDTGTKLSADISSSLIITVFAHDTPLHDGAAVIGAGKVVAAGCFLPLSEQVDIRRSFGTRHRAALGLAEGTDAVVLVVSEESGALSLAYDANLYYDLGVVEIRKRLKELLHYQQETEEEKLATE